MNNYLNINFKISYMIVMKFEKICNKVIDLIFGISNICILLVELKEKCLIVHIVHIHLFIKRFVYCLRSNIF